MYYFLTANIAEQLSGIEHAEIKRLNLFKKKGVPAKIIGIEYNRFVYDNLDLIKGLEKGDYLNFYEYFAQSLDFEPRKTSIKDIPGIGNYEIKDIDGNKFAFFGNRKAFQIVLRGDELDYISYFDSDGILLEQDFYDSRGFISLIKYYAYNENNSDDTPWVNTEEFVSPSGRIYFKKFYRKSGDGIVNTNQQLTGPEGRIYSVMNQDEAFGIFLDYLNQEDGGKNVFIADRSNIANIAMINMQTPAFKIEHFHNIHVRDYWDTMGSPLVYPSIANTEQLSSMDMILTPTQNQADDMVKRLRTQVPINAVPVGIVADGELDRISKLNVEKIKGKIVTVARIFPEKHLDDAVRAFKLAHDKLPWITLDIYGYAEGTGEEKKKVEKVIAEYNLEEIVKLKGYTGSMDEIYGQAELTMMTSRFEGFVLAILEAATYGIPCVSYDTNYGPSYLVKEGVSGYIVPNGDYQTLADRIVTIFSDDKKLSELSLGASERARDFTEDKVWEEWQNKVLDAVHLWKKS
ncbi:glycosyltransferase [Floricoccus penangensis]|uniref:glycosyltransferase n=1 Tax=Floricoccus penangensis TaxID=1859475 RepID=UPI00203D1425|nr:glycosyltransferase [Floricoccus penangensis]URZ86554.1 glycosyltransferase [Floricoccus penangensis]